MRLEDMPEFKKVFTKPSGLVVYRMGNTFAVYDPKENVVVALYKRVKERERGDD